MRKVISVRLSAAVRSAGLLPDAEIDTCAATAKAWRCARRCNRPGSPGVRALRSIPRATVGYLEAHIEQGAELEDTGRRIGIVTAIVGSHRFRIVFEGVQNHAGTTRMAVRKDAGVALVRLAACDLRRFPEVAGPRTVWTTGRITLDPGAPSIVPGRAEMLFQFRDTDPALLALLERELETLVAEATRGPCDVVIAERVGDRCRR